jgi:putative membrane protein
MSWDFKPSVIIGCCALLAGYGWAVSWRFRLRALLWLLGVVLIFVALCSPLDELADTYLFSVHMAKHILFVLVVPALLLMALPAGPVRRALRQSKIRSVEVLLRNPPVAWAAGIGVMLFWHIPALFNVALANEPLHIIEHLSLLAGGTIYWWPVLSPVPESRMRPVPQAAAYLFTSCLACTAIGIAITFASSLLYPAYAHPEDVSGILPVIRERWGISAAMDQQIGGLLMWVPGCTVYLTAIMAMFARWYAEESQTAMEV